MVPHFSPLHFGAAFSGLAFSVAPMLGVLFGGISC